MCRRRLARTILVYLAVALLCAAARAQGVNSLEGRVVLPSGAQPAQSVRVTLTQSGRPIYETFTDLSGRFNFSGLRAGTYQLTAEGDGQTFETTSVTFDIGSFGGAQILTQNIQLRPNAGASTPPAAAIAAEEIDPEVPDVAKEKYRQGMKSAADNKPEQAVKFFAEAVESYSRFYAANLALAAQLSKLQRYDEALSAYRRAGELKPDRAEPYVGIGVTLVSEKRYDEGIKMLRGVVEVDKDLPAPYLSLGYAEMMKGDYRAAEEHLLRSLELARPALARVYLANVYEQTSEFAKAVAQLESYLRENPRSPQSDAVRDAIEKLKRKAKEKKQE
ncbi:MAG TPA: carboxypeptidase regulatory-like domain-containing protein [Pyrinomonadaceae bacterium]|nr:carboxypeptidase regulatory-like domain-containing protein [Pyrinomonadaceae bacterium]